MTDAPKWTPGPWGYGEDRRGRKRVYADGREIVRALSEHGARRLPLPEREANARLIAAADEMYCEHELTKGTLQDLLDTGEVHEDAVPDVKRAIQRIEAVQRKARGESS